MTHPEMFCAAGLFTGFLYPSDKPEERPAYLKALDDAETFNREVPVFFRAMGLDEVSIPLFQEESAICDAKGIHYIAQNYPGGHEWRMWRRCFYEFVQLIFTDQIERGEN